MRVDCTLLQQSNYFQIRKIYVKLIFILIVKTENETDKLYVLFQKYNFDTFCVIIL